MDRLQTYSPVGPKVLNIFSKMHFMQLKFFINTFQLSSPFLSLVYFLQYEL